jgi:probable rRNA maturation factor
LRELAPEEQPKRRRRFALPAHSKLMIEVVNRQRKLKLDCEYWEKFAAKALKVAPPSAGDVTIVFVSDRAMRTLNRTWRGKRGTTDVLSFPAGLAEFENLFEGTLGDIVVSVEQAARQAGEQGLSLDAEIAQLILHGLLHLCGYDHETDNGEMNRLEVRLRRRLGV